MQSNASGRPPAVPSIDPDDMPLPGERIGCPKLALGDKVAFEVFVGPDNDWAMLYGRVIYLDGQSCVLQLRDGAKLTVGPGARWRAIKEGFLRQ